MEHLLAADVLLGEQAALPLANSNAYATIAHSVFYFASRVVDKLWHGQFFFCFLLKTIQPWFLVLLLLLPVQSGLKQWLTIQWSQSKIWQGDHV